MSALRELIAKFFVDADTKELEKAKEKVDGFFGKLKEVGEAVLEVFAVEKIHEFVESQVAAGAQLKIMSERLGIGTSELQSMQLAAGQAGVSAEALSTSLRFLNRNISNAGKAGSEQAKTFKDLHIELKNGDGTARNSADVLADLADRVAEIKDPAKQTAVAMQLLGRGGAQLLPLLKRGGEAFKEAREEMERLGGGMSEDFVESAHEAEASQVRLNFALEGLKSRIAAQLLPLVEKVVHFFTDLAVHAIDLTKHTDALSHAMQFLGAVAGVKMTQTLIKLGTQFGLLKPHILGTVRAMLGFALPLVLVGLLYFAFDELSTLLKGGDTLIGDALGPDKAEFINNLRSAVDKAKEGFSAFGQVIGSDGTSMGAFTTLVVDAAKAVAWLAEALSWVTDGLASIMEGLTNVGLALPKALGIKSGSLGGGMNGLTPYAVASLGGEGVIDQAPKSLINRTPIEQTPADALQNDYAQFAAQWPGRGALAPAQVPNSKYSASSANQGVVVNQTNSTHVEVHGVDANDAKAVGDATGAGVADAQQRANAKTYELHNQP